jgi:DNA modification methylase
MDKDAKWPHNIEVCICRVPIRKRDGFSIDKLTKFAEKLKTHMVKNGIVFMICYAPVEDKSRPFTIGKSMMDVGFTYIDNIIVEKSWYPGKRSEVNLVNSHEYVLHFCNGKVWKLDRLPIKEYLGIDQDISCPGNTWKVETGSLDDSYPVDLAELLIRMTDCLPGSVIFDPFMGSSAALKVALKLGHSFYGFEKDDRRMKKYNKIVKEFGKDKK